jgi:hypothetical protein
MGVLDRGYANFLELRKAEVRRIPLLGTWVNKASLPKVGIALGEPKRSVSGALLGGARPA